MWATLWDEVTLTATLSDSNAMVSAVTLGGMAIADSDFSDGITVPSLLVGANPILLTVTAEDGTITSYLLTVTRAVAPPPPPVVAVLVSNAGQTRETGQNVGNVNGNQGQYAQKFTTGSNPNGYILDDVILDLEGVGANAMPVITIRAAQRQAATIRSIRCSTP